MLKVIYICGPFRNKTQWGMTQNIRHAEEVALQLWRDNWAVICPHLNTQNFQGELVDDVWLQGDLEILSRCDAVYVLVGWIDSEGARQEVALAEKLGLEIIYEPDKLDSIWAPV